MVINPSLDALTACRKEYFNKLNHKPKQTTTPPRPADPWQTLRHTSNRSCHTTRSPWNIITHWSQFVYLLCTHVCLRPLTYTPLPSIYPVPWPAQPRGHLHQSFTNSLHLVYPSLSPSPSPPFLTQPVCPQMLEQYCSVHLAQGVGGLH